LFKLLAANGKMGELLSGSVPSHIGLAGSYSFPPGGGMLTEAQAGCAGSYSLSFEADIGGLDGTFGSEVKERANGDELSPS
jgi:hypothetical protein